MSAWSWLDPRAVAAWTDFAASGEAEADRKEFTERIHRQGWTHMYPPQFFGARASEEMSAVALRLSELISSLPGRIFGDDLDAWVSYLGVPADDAQLMCEALRRPHLARVATAFMRPDLVVTDQGLQLVELNVATSLGGLSTCAPYTAATRDSGYAGFLKARGLAVRGFDTSKAWLDVFGSLVERHGDGPLHVFEATADPADIDSGRRFFVDMVRSAGYEVSCGLVHDLEATDEGVYFEGRRVDAIFTAYTWHETKHFVPPALTRRLMELDTAGVVSFIGSPAAALYDNKANLALLFDEEFADVLSREELALVEAHVPETFRLRAETLDRAIAGRDTLVCKPSSAYGGKDLVFGPTTDAARWRTVLTERLQDPTECYVLQRHVPPAVVELPGTSPSGREVVLAPLVFGGSVAGVFVRQAVPRPASAINASSGAESAGALWLA
ncbi:MULTISPECIES: hypothetical protein [Streptomyces]|uniref:Glutathionylspermidine synthase pre-ATP-grasp-like domain-containing protein n=2 Tax=Streptomyces TaxID=1883 RepID=A0ABU4K3I3_9ACTN|nr:hypothetical protein [Streptomyces roseolus]MDX2292316.1 hypothetical protein [Streptomyces roseolus]